MPDKPITQKYDTKPLGVMNRLPDLGRDEKTTSWKPKTKLVDGLAKTYEWAEKRLLSEQKPNQTTRHHFIPYSRALFDAPGWSSRTWSSRR